MTMKTRQVEDKIDLSDHVEEFFANGRSYLSVPAVFCKKCLRPQVILLLQGQVLISPDHDPDCYTASEALHRK